MKAFVLLLLATTIATAQTPSQDSKPEQTQQTAPATASSTLPTLDAGIGPCTAEFHVADKDGKPVYDAKIHTLIKHGAFGVKKTELQMGTNADGRAKLTGLPDVNKRPIFFDVNKGTLKAQRAFDPGSDCHPVYEVALQ